LKEAVEYLSFNSVSSRFHAGCAETHRVVCRNTPGIKIKSKHWTCYCVRQTERLIC